MFRCLIFVDFVAVTAVVVVVGYGKETASTPTKVTKNASTSTVLSVQYYLHVPRFIGQILQMGSI